MPTIIARPTGGGSSAPLPDDFAEAVEILQDLDPGQAVEMAPVVIDAEAVNAYATNRVRGAAARALDLKPAKGTRATDYVAAFKRTETLEDGRVSVVVILARRTDAEARTLADTRAKRTAK